MTGKKKYRAVAIGHTGFGGYGHRLQLSFQDLNRVEFVAVADPDEAGHKKAVEEGRAPLSSASDAVAALEMIHGAYESHMGKRRVFFPLAVRTHPLEHCCITGDFERERGE